MNFELSQHARKVQEERSIRIELVRQTLDDPAWIAPDPFDPQVMRYLRPIPEFGGRVLRVAVNVTVEPRRGYSVLRSIAERNAMTLPADKQADALYLRLDDSPIVESEEVSPGVVLDFNDQKIVGVELLHLSRRTSKLKLNELQFQRAEPRPLETP